MWGGDIIGPSVTLSVFFLVLFSLVLPSSGTLQKQGNSEPKFMSVDLLQRFGKPQDVFCLSLLCMMRKRRFELESSWKFLSRSISAYTLSEAFHSL